MGRVYAMSTSLIIACNAEGCTAGGVTPQPPQTKEELTTAGVALCKNVEIWLMDLLSLAQTPINIKEAEKIEECLFEAYRKIHWMLYVALPNLGGVVGSCLNVEGVLYRHLQMTSCALAASMSSTSLKSNRTEHKEARFSRASIAARHSSALAALLNDVSNSRCFEREAIPPSSSDLQVVGSTSPNDDGTVCVVADIVAVPSPEDVVSSACRRLSVNSDLVTKVLHNALKSSPSSSTVVSHLHLTRTIAAPLLLGQRAGSTSGTLPPMGAWRSGGGTASETNSVDPVLARAQAAADDRVSRLEEEDGCAGNHASAILPPSASFLYTSLANGSKSSRLLVEKYVINTLFNETQQEMEFAAAAPTAGGENEVANGSGSNADSSSIIAYSSCAEADMLEGAGKVAPVSACRDTDQITRVVRSVLFSMPLTLPPSNGNDNGGNEKPNAPNSTASREALLRSLLFSRRAVVGVKRPRGDVGATTTEVAYDVLEPRCVLPTKTALEDFFSTGDAEINAGGGASSTLRRMCLLERIAMTHEVPTL